MQLRGCLKTLLPPLKTADPKYRLLSGEGSGPASFCACPPAAVPPHPKKPKPATAPQLQRARKLAVSLRLGKERRELTETISEQPREGRKVRCNVSSARMATDSRLTDYLKCRGSDTLAARKEREKERERGAGSRKPQGLMGRSGEGGESPGRSGESLSIG